jgi:hypothetical protein
MDLKNLREHYASLSDDALLEIERADLVEAAQQCYDDEVRQRPHLSLKPNGDDQPDWLEDASTVFSRNDWPGSPPTDVAEARDVLEAAGIPCHLELVEETEGKPTSPEPTHVWQVMVPGTLNLHATSDLDRDIFNADYEETWRTHLEMLSDEEVLEMKPEVAFCGLFDRVERVTRAYDEELSRRRLKSEST